MIVHTYITIWSWYLNKGNVKAKELLAAGKVKPKEASSRSIFRLVWYVHTTIYCSVLSPFIHVYISMYVLSFWYLYTDNVVTVVVDTTYFTINHTHFDDCVNALVYLVLEVVRKSCFTVLLLWGKSAVLKIYHYVYH